MKSKSALIFFACVLTSYGLVLSAQQSNSTQIPNQQAKSSGTDDSRAIQEKAKRKDQAGHIVDGPLRREREAKVHQANREVQHCEADLQRAEASGNTQKIEHRKVKLADARRELQDAQADLAR
jgi:hypothetical protein